MKNMFLLGLTMALMFTVLNLSFAGDEFQLNGIITKIDGKQITIQDNKGKEVVVEVSGSGFKVGDRLQLFGQIIRALTVKDVEFLTMQCQISQTDIDIIPTLPKAGQAEISKWTAARDCKKLTPFKNTRNYYRQLKPKEKLTMPPPGWSGMLYLTDDEFQRYYRILEEAPL